MGASWRGSRVEFCFVFERVVGEIGTCLKLEGERLACGEKLRGDC